MKGRWGLDAPVLQAIADQVESREAFVARVHYLNEHHAEDSREELLLSDGRTIDRYSAPAVGVDRRYHGRVWYFRDITDRKASEKRIVYLSRVYAVLSGINTLIVRVRNREELFSEACRIAVEVGGFRMSLIATVDPVRGGVVPVASAGKGEELLTAIRGLLSSANAPDTMVGRAIQDRKAIVSNDSQNDPRIVLGPMYVESGVRSMAILPLLVSGDAVGVVALFAGEIEFFHEAEMELLKRLAGDIAFGIGMLDDRLGREHADEALRSSLREKEALLKEVHHRVKNNMQVISSLIRLESNRITQPATKAVLTAMQNRILAMAAIHEGVYRSKDFSQVDLASYLRQLTNQLSRSLVAAPGQISIDLDLASVGLDLERAVPCGLIVNELVSNALKHGFPAGRTGAVHVELKPSTPEELRLTISDNGVGLPKDFEAIRAKSLGLQLVSDLTRQLGGRLRVGPGPQALFEVTFSPNPR